MIRFQQMRASGRPGLIAGVLYYIGFFLLFCCLGTFGSAALVAYRATKWLAASAQVQDCSLGKYPLAKEPKMYNLQCGITYQLAGHSYKNVLNTRLTRSIQERDAINDWISSNRGATMMNIRVNPSYPHEFVVQTRLPGKRGQEAGDFANAGIVLGSISLVLLASAHTMARRGTLAKT